MPLIVWTAEQFATHVRQHDEEHKELFDLLNSLHDVVASGERDNISIALDKLIAFIAQHFASEERHMSLVNYREFVEHKEEHDSLMKFCDDLQAEFDAGLTQISEQTTLFLRDWLCRHIPSADFKYAPALFVAGIR